MVGLERAERRHPDRRFRRRRLQRHAHRPLVRWRLLLRERRRHDRWERHLPAGLLHRLVISWTENNAVRALVRALAANAFRYRAELPHEAPTLSSTQLP